MGEYVKVNGHATWVDVWGSGQETVVLLHGGLSNSDPMMDTIGRPIAERYRVVVFDRRGHGRTADTPAPFHYDDMVSETIDVLKRVVGGPAHLVGWSDGGIVALLLALQRPELVGKIVAIGANFHYEGMLPMPDSTELFTEISDAYAQRSPDGPEHLPEVMKKALTLFATEPTLTTDDLRRIETPTLVLVGDDELIRLEHTCELYQALPAGQLAVIPAASHAVPLEKPAEVARLIRDFLAQDGPPQTLIPIRRAPADHAAG